MFTNEQVEHAIAREEQLCLEIHPHNHLVFDALDNVRLYLGLPRPLMDKASSLRKTLSFGGKAKE